MVICSLHLPILPGPIVYPLEKFPRFSLRVFFWSYFETMIGISTEKSQLQGYTRN